MLLQIRHYHQSICSKNGQNPQYTERFLPEHPTPFVFHPLEKEFLEWIERRLGGETIINILVVFICLEPQPVGIREEYQAKEQEDDDKTERRLSNHFEPLRRKERKNFLMFFFVIFAPFAVKEL